ncbi:bifunctional folylpolyglutamate synthase/dihydrofolate synthase [Treponema phagedenis]|uniref:bifunctional folylpolyglutamate synthase/dihydrofolate synthase n=1 Tax=Treponema phagedenis TaxID=162 RepID=UPI0001F63DAE|nr:folylpolyglutamate synthase/dihydrofolate synthase family protein [Treponema phagedenis]EFW38436.1 bifunctional protein FolC [Treponema phagedenis F0421]TYT78485.1 bifunctional folylpolyglutamate synthase/dihydrofolate synthase [Treponema phagedenis]
MKFSTEEFCRWLDDFANFEQVPKPDTFTLEGIRNLAEMFDNPQNAYKSIHLAGSKGKGSTSTMIASILDAAGFQTGLYTSPHVCDFRERVSRAGVFFSDAEYAEAYAQIHEKITAKQNEDSDFAPTWFELVTLLAFELFKECGCNWAVFETGMGGRLDATNIIQPEACVLMPIELEHCKFLGDTLAKIAAEKAGIIKEGCPVFCFDQQEEALRVFKTVAEQKHAPFFYLPELITKTESSIAHFERKVCIHFNAATKPGSLFARPLSVNLKLLDEFQIKNAALAAAAVKYLLPELSEEIIEKGLAQATLPARFEVVQKEPLIVVDGAHTKNSIAGTLATFLSIAPEKFILLFACAEDKSSEEFAPLFLNHAAEIFLTIPGVFKKSNFERTRKAFLNTFQNEPSCPIHADENFSLIIRQAFEKSKTEKRPLLVIGSFYLAGEVKRALPQLAQKD